MPASGLIALLDDIASIADDVATLSAAAAKKTSGIVTDDMAVTAEQAIGIRREREIPVVLAVARGSFFNKAVILTPGALLLNAVAPWAIMPLLMAGGAFLCFEGVEKILHKLLPHHEHAEADDTPLDAEAFERTRVQGAIRTDLILSGEIIAITLGQVRDAVFVTQAATLYVVSVVMTIGVYGMVAGLIKLDDLGEALARRSSSAALGRAIVKGTPWLFHAISIIGTIAMLMVGGHILREGFHPIEKALHSLLERVPPSVHGIADLGADVLVGAVAGGILVAIMATGLPQKLWGRVRRKR